MKAVDILMEEHSLIERALSLLELCARTDPFPAEKARALIGFFRGFADGCHHAREEDVLFPALRKVMGTGGPVEAMLHEHELCREYVNRMEKSLSDPPNRREFKEAALGYSGLLSGHIDKEGGIVFPLAESLIGNRDGELTARFEEIEASQPPGAHEGFYKLIEELEARL